MGSEGSMGREVGSRNNLGKGEMWGTENLGGGEEGSRGNLGEGRWEVERI